MKIFHLILKLDQWFAKTPLFFRHSSDVERTIFFPGCSLSAYSPYYVLKVHELINKKIKCGAMLACCAKPLKLIGEEKVFQNRIKNIINTFDKMETETVITACQSCFKILNEYDKKHKIISLWPFLLKIGLPDECIGKYKDFEVSIQDSCVTRNINEITVSVRELLKQMGITVREMKCSLAKAKCCGGIQMIKTGDVKFAHEYMRKRASESPCNNIISYCASCRSAMSIDNHKSLHLLDLIFNNAETFKKSSGFFNRIKTGYLITKL